MTEEYEDPGTCPYCDTPFELVRPGKSQPSCDCQDTASITIGELRGLYKTIIQLGHDRNNLLNEREQLTAQRDRMLKIINYASVALGSLVRHTTFSNAEIAMMVNNALSLLEGSMMRDEVKDAERKEAQEK